MADSNNIRKTARRPFLMKLFMLKNMPMGLLAGLRVVEFDDKHAVVTVPYKHLNINPFQSMYFAVMSMAAELSSGVQAIALVSEAPRPMSMLVFKMEASFTKKARTRIRFVCNDGEKIAQAINESLKTGEGKTVDVTSTGYDAEGDVVAIFQFTWTFKPKKVKNN